MSPVGAITHRGSPIQFGGEKEFNLEGLSGNKLEHTEPEALKPELLAQIAGDKQWAQLTDAEKARYSLEHKKLTGEFPVLRVKPNNDYVATDFEPNGWVEVISKRFDSPAEIRTFLDKFGWGHIHTSFMRGAPPEEQAQQVAWTCNANLYMFLSSLERRGGTDLWPFAIKGLSVPTEDHLEYFARILRGEELRTTAFSKHLMLNIRSGTKYGERNRIGGETRGGVQNEKERVLDSLLTGLTDGAWGRSPQKSRSGLTPRRWRRCPGTSRRCSARTRTPRSSTPSWRRLSCCRTRSRRACRSSISALACRCSATKSCRGSRTPPSSAWSRRATASSRVSRRRHRSSTPVPRTARRRSPV
jgi:hypothetical protein